jgi:hypothetical protein
MPLQDELQAYDKHPAVDAEPHPLPRSARGGVQRSTGPSRALVVAPGSAEACGCGKPATKTTDDGERLCSECYAAVPNEYDLAFVRWFASHGWQIHVTPSGVDVWTTGDARCPFRVTRGMIERLEWGGKIERIFPRDAAVLDYVWVISPNDKAQPAAQNP